LINGAVEKSTFDGQFLSTIASEGGKIDINDLGSNIESLREATRKQLLTLFEAQRENDDKFRDNNYGTDFNELLNNIADWVDEGDESLNGGPEGAEYQNIPSDSAEFIPPNTPFKTIEELNMVSGMTDEFFEILAPRVTVFGVKGINVNYAPKEVLMSMAPTMSEEAVAEILARRSDPNIGGPFVDDNDFLGFLESQRVDTQPIRDSNLPLYYGTVFNFRVTSTGVYSNVTREIEVIVYDFDNLKERYIEIVNKEEAEKNSNEDEQENEDDNRDKNETESANGNGEGGSSPGGKIKVPKGRPTVVYWKES
jgi:general secretion pathway protein K